MKRAYKIIIIPLFFSILSVILHSKICIILFILSIYYVVDHVKSFKHYQNIGIFFISGLSLIPINISLINYWIVYSISSSYPLLFNFIIILMKFILYIFIFLLEEYLFLYAGRIIFKNQYTITFDDD